MAHEQTLIIFKPEALERKLVGKLLDYWDSRDFQLVKCDVRIPTREEIIVHYNEVLEGLSAEDQADLIKRMTRGPCLIAVYKGADVIATSRHFLGATDPKKAAPGTIRHTYGTAIAYNVAHASDSPASAKREMLIWFGVL